VAKGTNPSIVQPIDLIVDKDTATRSMKKTEEQLSRIAQVETAKRQQRIKTISETGTAKLNLSRITSEQRLNAQLEAMQKKHNLRMQLDAERARAKMLQGHQTWSAKMTKSLSNISRGLGAMAAAWGLMQIRSMISGTISWAGEMATAAQSVDTTVEAFSALSSAAQSVGMKGESMTKALQAIQYAMAQAARQPKGIYAEQLKAFGVETSDSMEVIIDKLLKVNDMGQLALLVGARNASVLKRIGDRYTDLNGVMEKNASLSEEAANKLDDLGAAFSRFGTQVKTVSANVLAPTMTGFLDLITATMRARGTGSAAVMMELAKIAADKGLQRALKEDSEALEENAESLEGATEKAKAYREEQEKLLAVLEKKPSKPSVEDERPAPKTATEAMIDRTNKALEERSALLNGIRETTRRLDETTQAESDNAAEQYRQLIENEKRYQETLKERREAIMMVAQGMTSLVSEVNKAFVSFADNKLAAHQERIAQLEQEYQFERDSMQAVGIEGTEQAGKLLKAKQRALEQARKKETAMKSDSWEKQKLANTADVIMNTALGIMKAIGSIPPPLSYYMAAIASAQGAVQLAVVQAQQNPYKRREGGWVPGGGYSDTVPVQATPGEFVVRRDVAQANARGLEALNSGARLSQGNTTIVKIDTVIGEADWVQSSLMPRINEAVRAGHVLRAS